MRNRVQLITYADRLGGTLAGTGAVIREHLAGAVGGVHLLPFFTPYDGADAGFDPQDHTAVDPRLGSWDDVRTLAQDLDVVVDVIVNHVSSDSAAFLDFRERGAASPSASMFLTFGSVFPEGATEADLTAVYRPRPGLPFTPVTVAGEKRLLWTTFTPQQIDIDVRSEPGAAYLGSILRTLADAGVSMVRLDAVGYAIKTPGTSSFMTPETFDFIEAFTAQTRGLGMDVLVEVHSHYESQVQIGALVDRVYDFALPPLVLHSLYSGDAAALRHWLDVRPRNCVTVLDTHDGIGVIDVGPDAITGRPGLLTPAQVDALVEGIHAATGGASRQATGAAASNLDLYQVNSTFYDALGRDDARYLAARAIQLFAPGIPQVYYVGALAGENDMDLLARTAVGRDINRHVYGPGEVAHEVQRPVVRAQLALMRLRNEHPAFDGDFTLEPATDGATDDLLTMTWRAGADHALLAVGVADASASLEWTTATGTARVDDLLDAEGLDRR
ncbi:MAG TPA: sucrose phosphorylase [Cellulomonas sp.]